MKAEEFVGKNCKLVYMSGFILDGTVTDVNYLGVTFETPQKTSFISWHVIRDISLNKESF